MVFNENKLQVRKVLASVAIWMLPSGKSVGVIGVVQVGLIIFGLVFSWTCRSFGVGSILVRNTSWLCSWRWCGRVPLIALAINLTWIIWLYWCSWWSMVCCLSRGLGALQQIWNEVAHKLVADQDFCLVTQCWGACPSAWQFLYNACAGIQLPGRLGAELYTTGVFTVSPFILL